MSDLTGYNLVLASTESALNNSLEYANFWKVTINYQPASDLDPPPGLVGAQISAPTLRLSGSDLANNQASVTLHFTAGTLQYFDVFSGDTLSTDITGWTITFAANIGQGAIPEGADLSQLPEQVQEALTNEVLSVGQLFLELSTVVWANVAITDADGNSVTDSTISETLEKSIQGWAQSIESSMQQWVLNYVITNSNGSGNPPAQSEPGKVLADLVPTSYNFSVSKYDPPDKYDDLSTLNYLMMTDGHSAPTANSAGIFDSNWVEGPNTQEYQGTVAIDGDLFNKAYVESELLPAIATAVGAPDTSFTEKDTGHWNLYKKVDKYGNQNDGKGRKKEGLGVAQAVYENIIEELNCDVKLNPSTATYEISGTYYAKSIVTVEFLSWDATDSSFHTEYTLPWSFSIQLKASEGGTLTAESTTVEEGESTTSQGGDDFGGDIWNAISVVFSSFLDTYSKQFQNEAKSISQANFSDISDQLQTTMGDISKTIVFPAGNRFAYKDIRFTGDTEQNLLAYLTYIS